MHYSIISTHDNVQGLSATSCEQKMALMFFIVLQSLTH